MEKGLRWKFQPRPPRSRRAVSHAQNLGENRIWPVVEGTHRSGASTLALALFWLTLFPPVGERRPFCAGYTVPTHRLQSCLPAASSQPRDLFAHAGLRISLRECCCRAYLAATVISLSGGLTADLQVAQFAAGLKRIKQLDLVFCRLLFV